MTDELVDTVSRLARADAALSASAERLILAAMDGEESLRRALAAPGDLAPSVPMPAPGPAGGTPEAAGGQAAGPKAAEPEAAGSGDAAPEDAGPAAGRAPARAYLARVTVSGFRGIGPAAVLDLAPGPGLTVVAGRNGSGKSSFAEALEVALTRRSYRWAKRSAVWSESWRNLRHPHPARIVVELAEEGVGTTTVTARWAAGAGLDDVSIRTRRPGRTPGDLGALGWDHDLDLFRPFLSYEELGALFAEPSKLHDALAGILGLDRLEDAAKLLTARLKDVAAPALEAGRLARQLLPDLLACPDDRARTAAALLRCRTPQPDRVAELVTGAAPADQALTLLRRLARLRAPDPQAWRTVRADLDEAARQHAEALAAVGAANLRTTSLLRAALEHFEQHGAGACPVCGRGDLDDAWARDARTDLERAGHAVAAVDAARAQAGRARAALGEALPALADVLAAASRPGPDGLDQEPGLPELVLVAADRWRGLQALAADPDAAIGDVEAAFAVLGDAVQQVVTRAGQALSTREDAWQPLALRVAGWLTVARRAERAAPAAADLRAAERWLKANLNDLRNARIAPLADRARQIWSALRQESNVDLGGLTLEGSATRRRVELAATVDGEDAGAFGVLSQGEQHALALALFLPRATAANSPFGFIVVDDPVQAMDPAKVDGLARVLQQTAADRQVVVLTHDDRLPEAVRRLQIPARILEVTRDVGSVVAVHRATDPADRYLSDARAVASDPAVPDDVASRVVPELCRLALEATCRDVWFRAQFARGGARADVERSWARARTTRARLALAVRGDQNASLDAWLTQRQRRAALTVCAAGVHVGLPGNAHQAVRDVERVVRELAGTRA